MSEQNLEKGLSPEDKELALKKAELERLEARLAQRELDLLTFELELREFEQLYLRIVGVLYAELDEIKAKIAEAKAASSPNDESAQKEAAEARAQAEESAHSTESVRDTKPLEKFKPSDSLKKLYRELARLLHPDLVLDEKEKAKRHVLMAKANKAYEDGDEELLAQMLADQLNSPDEIKGDGLGAELIRVIRQISRANERLMEIDKKFTSLEKSEFFELKSKAVEAESEGRDLLAEIATSIRTEIVDAQRRSSTKVWGN